MPKMGDPSERKLLRLGFMPTFEVGETDERLRFVRLHVVRGPLLASG